MIRKNIQKQFYLLLTIAPILFSNSQSSFSSDDSQSKFGVDETKCKQNLSVYRENYKQKNYSDAISPWRWVFYNCPASSGNIYKNGPRIIKEKLKKDKANKDAYVDTILMIFDQRIKYGFGDPSYILGLKGYELVSLDKTRSQEAYDILNESISKTGNSSHFTAVYGLMQAVVNLEQKGIKTKSDVLDVYAIISKIIDFNMNNQSKLTKYFVQYAEKVDELFAPYANCDELNILYMAELDSRSDDLDFLKRVEKTLKKQKCTESDLFNRVNREIYKLNPSASSAYLMAVNSIKNRNYLDAISYAKEAIEMESESNLKASYYLILADAYRSSGSFSSARSSVYSALKYKKGWGEAYMSLGNIYVSGAKNCGEGFEMQSVYWVAVDAYKKALNDSQTKKRASKAINTYSKYFPSKEDCFFGGFSSGDNYKVGCWINQSTSVRTSN